MRNVCFTAWDADVEFDPDRMKYLIIGKEICPTTNKEHQQGYVEFKRQTDFGVVKTLLGSNTHIEPRNGTAVQAIEYCKKEGNYEEHGTPSKQGKRSDLDVVAEQIQEGNTVREVAISNPVQYIKYHRGIEKLRSLYIQPRNWETEVIILYGKTGTGKSRMAREMCQDYWVWTPARGKWFDGYDGHEHVIMEEFRAQLPLGFMLTLLDRYECPVEVKGGTVEFCPKKIVITSPKHPRDWYEDQPNDKIEQLLRRASKVSEVAG